MDSYVGKKTETICGACQQGWLHQYPQDLQGELRCGRCGELDEKTVRARIKTPVDVTSGSFPEGAVITTAAKPATTRRAK